MAIMNFALLALVPFVLARPQVGHGEAHKGFHGPHTAGTGLPGPFSHHAPAASGTAPFPVPGGNGTSGAATGSSGLPATSSSGPVYITSVISVVPQPVYTDVTDTAQGSGGAGNSGVGPASATGGSPGGPEGTGSPEGTGAAGTECGPATVTITSANTVTVTVTPAGSAGNAGASSAAGAGAGSSLPVIPSSAYVPPSQSAPFPIGNSSVPLGSGTGTAPVAPVSTSSSAAVAAVVATSTSLSVPTAQPYQTPAEKYVQPVEHHSKPAYVAPPPASSAPPPPPASSAQAVSSASGPAPSSGPKNTGPKTSGPKGVAYNTPAQATQIEGINWACNWGQTMDVPGGSFDFVPQLWGQKPGMADSIKGNCAGKSACLFYNEPDIPQSEGGSEIPVGTAITDYQTLFLNSGLRSGTTKTSTPCVANSGLDYMTTWLEGVGKGNVDIMCFHWYGPDLGGLQGVVSQFKSLADQYGIEELWINEFAVQPAPQSLSEFTSYLDGAVTRYAYNMNDMEGSTGY